MGAVAERVEQALAPCINERGLDLEHVEVQPAGRRRLVRVLVDRDGGVNLDEVAELSSHLSDVLDESGAMGDQPYVLEVSSPGVDRPFTSARHWRRALGRLVNIELTNGDTFVGRVKQTEDTSAVIVTEETTREVSFAAVARASVQVEFRHPPVAADEPTTNTTDADEV